MGAPVLSLLPLAVQILIPASSEEQQAILEACTLAHSGQACERVAIGSEPDSLRGRVSVLGPSRVLVEVRADRESDNYLSVELSFSEQDQARERARSIGLSLGTLASSLEQQAKRAEQAEAERAEEPEPIGAVEPAPRAMLPIRAGVGVSYDPSWETPALRGDLRAQWAPTGRFFFGLAGNAEFAPGSTPRPTLTSFGGNAGLGYAVATGAVRWFPQLALGASFNLLNVKGSSVETAQGARASAALSASLHCLIPIQGRLYLSLLPEVELLLPPTNVFVDDEQVGGLGPLRFALTVGAAWNTTP